MAISVNVTVAKFRSRPIQCITHQNGVVLPIANSSTIARVSNRRVPHASAWRIQFSTLGNESLAFMSRWAKIHTYP